MLKVNRNFLWTETFVNTLANTGVKYCCISPGSRNTPLTLAFAQNKKIKTIVNVDERNSAFVALGLAKSSATAVAIVCTSGTAVAELYPAIIEAYQQRIPLIVCSADRPEYLLNTGANQTINQQNIYFNHIRYFVNSQLPSAKTGSIIKFLSEVKKALTVCLIKNRGPVHINFPFEKPLEPDSFTDTISSKQQKIIYSFSNFSSRTKIEMTNLTYFEKELLNDIRKFSKGIILFGPLEPRYRLRRLTSSFAQITGYPIFADGCSQLRYGLHNKNNVIANFDSLLRTKKFNKIFKPELVIQFGGTPTSKSIEDYFSENKIKRYVINEFGDNADPTRTSYRTLRVSPEILLEKLLCEFYRVKFKRDKNDFAEEIISFERMIDAYQKKYFTKIKFPDESMLVRQILNFIPEKSNLFISNSSPVRDLDNFGQSVDKDIKVYNNRGASGIDGITSTAIGIAMDSKQPTVLITGDLSFYYDINTLVNMRNIKSTFIIVLINNNGGGLFRALPIASNIKYFDEYFITGQNLNFKEIVSSFGVEHKEIKSIKQFEASFKSALKKRNALVLEIKTDSVSSLKTRQNFRKKVQLLLKQNDVD